MRAITGGDMKTYEVADGELLELREVTGTDGSIALADDEGLLREASDSLAMPTASWSRCRSRSGSATAQTLKDCGTWPVWGRARFAARPYIVPLTRPIRWPSGSLNWPRINPSMISSGPKTRVPPRLSALSSAAPTSGTPT